jgi:hypothetical protein
MSIINNTKTDPNKILPMTYSWARQHYKDGLANTWTPEEIPMQDDIEQWKGDVLSKEERRLVPLEPRLLLHCREPDCEQHRSRSVLPRDQSRVPPVPPPPGV